jgi:hypothetical protein
MTKRIQINGMIYAAEDVVFLDDGRIVEKVPDDGGDYTPRVLNARADGTFMPWEEVSDELSRAKENAKMDPEFLKVANVLEAAARDVQVLASTLRMAGVQGAKDAAGFARAAAHNVRAMADRIMNAGRHSSGTVIEDGVPTTYFREGSEEQGDGTPITRIGGK